jgi:hypothetical protein
LLLVAAPAFADTPLHQDLPIAWNDVNFQGSETDCAGLNLAPGTVDWHFVVHTDSSTGTMSATFSDSADNVTDMPPSKIVDTYELHWDIVTGEDSLLSASTSVTPSSDGFNLSHICSNPETVIPEAPASALLVLTAGITFLGFAGWRMRRSQSIA